MLIWKVVLVVVFLELSSILRLIQEMAALFCLVFALVSRLILVLVLVVILLILELELSLVLIFEEDMLIPELVSVRNLILKLRVVLAFLSVVSLILALIPQELVSVILELLSVVGLALQLRLF